MHDQQCKRAANQHERTGTNKPCQIVACVFGDDLHYCQLHQTTGEDREHLYKQTCHRLGTGLDVQVPDDIAMGIEDADDRCQRKPCWVFAPTDPDFDEQKQVTGQRCDQADEFMGSKPACENQDSKQSITKQCPACLPPIAVGTERAAKSKTVIDRSK